jgi:hypothetical protein
MAFGTPGTEWPINHTKTELKQFFDEAMENIANWQPGRGVAGDSELRSHTLIALGCLYDISEKRYLEEKIEDVQT